jgi:hypothetical protein
VWAVPVSIRSSTGKDWLTVQVMDSRLDMFFNALTQKSSQVMIPAASG